MSSRVIFNLVNGINTGEISYNITQSNPTGVILTQDGALNSTYNVYKQNVNFAYLEFKTATSDSSLITTGAYTIEFWAKNNTNTNFGNYGNLGFYLNHNENITYVGSYNKLVHGDGITGILMSDLSQDISSIAVNNKWVFITESRTDSGKYYFSYNGTMILPSYPSNINTYDFNCIRLFYGFSSDKMIGTELDGVKMTLGEAKYTAAFTPPTSYNGNTKNNIKTYLKYY